MNKLQTRSQAACFGAKSGYHRAGFTLVEILIVASLVGLLAFIAIPNYIRTRANAAKSACISNLKQIDNAVQQWAFEQRKSPSTTVTYADISPYLKYSVTCPAGGTSFIDSYSLATVSSEPICLRVPLEHLFPGGGIDVVTTNPGDKSGNQPPLPPSLPPGPGTGIGSGHGGGNHARPAPPPRLGPPHLPPNAGNSGQGGSQGNGNSGSADNGTGGNGSGSGVGSNQNNGNGNHGNGGSAHDDAGDHRGKEDLAFNPAR